jgi:glycogen(starch) synthase
MTPLRILYLSHEYPPAPLGGIGAYTQSMARTMAARGHDVHILSCVRGQSDADIDDEGVRVHRRPLRFSRLPRAQRGDSIIACSTTSFSCLVETRRLGLTFDVVESPDHMSEALMFGFRRGPPVAVCLHEGQREVRGRQPRDFLEERMIRRATLIRSPSRLVARAVIQSGWASEDRVRMVPVPLSVSDWPVGNPPPIPRILVPGNLAAFKAPEIALHAAAVLTREIPELEIVFVGRSFGHRSNLPYGEWLERVAQIFGVRCRVLGLVPRSEMARQYGSASVVALPSIGDNMPMVALEALASGRPVVCTTASGASEIVASTGAGSVVAPLDGPALARALRPFLIDDEKAMATGEVGRALVREACDPGLAGAAAETFYSETIERARGASR